MERIGVRELRQHASRYLERVVAGEDFEVTDRGRPVALLVPIPADGWDRLVASGRVLPPSSGTDVLDLEPGDHQVDASAELERLRADER